MILLKCAVSILLIIATTVLCVDQTGARPNSQNTAFSYAGAVQPDIQGKQAGAPTSFHTNSQSGPYGTRSGAATVSPISLSYGGGVNGPSNFPSINPPNRGQPIVPKPPVRLQPTPTPLAPPPTSPNTGFIGSNIQQTGPALPTNSRVSQPNIPNAQNNPAPNSQNFPSLPQPRPGAVINNQGPGAATSGVIQTGPTRQNSENFPSLPPARPGTPGTSNQGPGVVNTGVVPTGPVRPFSYSGAVSGNSRPGSPVPSQQPLVPNPRPGSPQPQQIPSPGYTRPGSPLPSPSQTQPTNPISSIGNNQPAGNTPNTPANPNTALNTDQSNARLQLATDAELEELSEALLKKDVNNAAKYVTTNYQGRTWSGATSDEAALPLLTVNEEAYNIPTIAKMRPLFNNYILDTATNEHVTAQERGEENELLDLMLSTTVMKQLMTFLESKELVTKDPKTHKDLLKTIWFNLYSRGGGKIGSSAFEHVFLSEIKNGEITGLHNWVYFNDEEVANRINYMGYIKKVELGQNKGAILKLRFNMGNSKKPVNSIFIGTSPELEMALYTACFMTRADRDCPIVLAGHKIIIRTYTYRYRGKKMIGSAFPEI